MSPTQTGAQRAAFIQETKDAGGPDAWSGEYIGKATKFWCDAAEFWHDKFLGEQGDE